MFRFTLIMIALLLLFNVKAQEVEHEHSVYHAFIENKGQWNDDVFFKNKFSGGNMWVEQGRILFQLQDYSIVHDLHFSHKDATDSLTYKEQLVTLDFVGAQPIQNISKKGKTKHYYNYFMGDDPDSWASDVHGYEEFTMSNLYEGIDVCFIEKEREIKYEFVVSPQTATDVIQLDYKHQEKLMINNKGDLVVTTELGDIIEKKPYAYQIVNGKINDIPCEYKLEDGIVTFDLGEYNKRVELIIDPTLVFATYNGALSDNFGMTATYGYDGTAYNGGTVYGNSYPMPDSGVFDPNSNMTVLDVNTATTDAFITKYSPDGTTMLWSTFFGGGNNTEGTDVTHSLICDKNNNVYVYGVTSSTDFPIVNGFQTTFAGGDPISVSYNGTNFGNTGTDIYVAKFSQDGYNLLGSTYVGGSKNDGINYMVSAGNYTSASAYDSLTTNYGDQFRGEIMLDSINNILIGSCTRSFDFPTQNAFQPTLAGEQDGVVFKIKNDFSGLEFSSFFGGSNPDAVYSAKIDSSKNIVFAGGTTSLDLPVSSGVYQSSYNGGVADGFIGKLSPDGLTLDYTTYIGTPNYDQVFFVEINRLDNVFVLGQSNGGTFPVINSSYSNPNSSQFIAKLQPDLSTITGSTVFGSGSTTFDISPSAFLVDICGNMYVSGWGGNVLQGSPPMSGMPVTPDAFQTTAPNGYDFYLTVIERNFNGLLYGSYLGGSSAQEHVDGGTSRFDKNGVVYQGVCCGCGGFSDFPTTPGAWSSNNNSSNCNALTFKFDFNLIPKAEFTVDNNMGCSPFEVTFENFSSDSASYLWNFDDGELDSTTYEPVVTYTTPGSYDVTLTVTDSVCLITDSAIISIEVFPDIDLSVNPGIDLCVPDTVTFTADANGTATSFVWSSNAAFSDTLNASTSDSTAQVNYPTDGYYYVKASNAGCSMIDSVLVSFTSAGLSLDGITNFCAGDQSTITATSTLNNIQFDTFDWSEDLIVVTGDGTNSVDVNPSSTQYLYVTATASNGCTVTDSILLSVSDIDVTYLAATASENTVPIGEDVTLSAEPSGYSYSWTPAADLTNPNSQETGATVNETTIYTVSVTDGICTKSDTVLVKAYSYKCEEPFLYVPNAFTPNGDQDNDVLYVRSTIVKDFVFRIFDRWGELVFESKSLHRGWDGTFREKLLDPDVYDYYVEGHCIDGQEFLIKGNVTLIR